MGTTLRFGSILGSEKDVCYVSFTSERIFFSVPQRDRWLTVGERTRDNIMLLISRRCHHLLPERQLTALAFWTIDKSSPSREPIVDPLDVS